MKEQKSKCVICEVEINTREEGMGISSDYGSRKYMRWSDEGTFFKYDDSSSGRWFCNKCWGEITKKIEGDKK